MENARFTRISQFAAVAVFSCLTIPWLRAQTADAQSGGADKSWTATSESSNDTTPLRTTESHTQSGNRTLDKKSVEQLGSDGRYEPYMDTETESVQVSPSTTRTVTRTFGRPSGERTLIKVEEEETQKLGDGNVKTLRTLSNHDVNDRLQVVQREVQETKQTSPGVKETRTTVFLPSVEGSLAPSSQTIELQKSTGEHSSEFHKSTEFRDGNGNWQVTETREGTIKQDGKDSVTDEQVLKPDSEGRLAVVSRTVSKEVEDANGDKHTTVGDYSTYTPGSVPDGSLHLSQRVTTRQKSGPGTQTKEQQVEARNPGDPSAGLHVSTKTIDIVRPSNSGTRETHTIQALTGNGDMTVVEIDTRTSDQTPAVKVDIAPPQKPK